MRTKEKEKEKQQFTCAMPSPYAWKKQSTCAKRRAVQKEEVVSKCWNI